MYNTTSHLRVSCLYNLGLIWMILTILTSILTPVASVAQEPTPTLAPNEFIASKIEDIVGVWESRFGGKVSYIHYKADGTFSHASTIENLERIPLFTGTFWFEGTVFNSKDQLSPRASYELRVHKKGETPIRLSYTVIDDPVSQRAKDLGKGKTWVASSPQEALNMDMSPEELDE